MATMTTMATVKSHENEVNENYSITIKKNWNDAHNNKQRRAQQQAAHYAQQVHQ